MYVAHTHINTNIEATTEREKTQYTVFQLTRLWFFDFVVSKWRRFAFNTFYIEWWTSRSKNKLKLICQFLILLRHTLRVFILLRFKAIMPKEPKYTVKAIRHSFIPTAESCPNFIKHPKNSLIHSGVFFSLFNSGLTIRISAINLNKKESRK